MNNSNAHPEGTGVVLSHEAMADLNRVMEAMESLETRMCVLSIHMQYERSPFAQRNSDLTRDMGEIHDLLQNILLFGS